MRMLASFFVMVCVLLTGDLPAQAQQSRKVCADQKKACMKNYAGPTCSTEYQMCMKSKAKQ